MFDSMQDKPVNATRFKTTLGGFPVYAAYFEGVITSAQCSNSNSSHLLLTLRNIISFVYDRMGTNTLLMMKLEMERNSVFFFFAQANRATALTKPMWIFLRYL